MVSSSPGNLPRSKRADGVSAGQIDGHRGLGTSGTFRGKASLNLKIGNGSEQVVDCKSYGIGIRSQHAMNWDSTPGYWYSFLFFMT